jgi:hypothetical protein
MIKLIATVKLLEQIRRGSCPLIHRYSYSVIVKGISIRLKRKRAEKEGVKLENLIKSLKELKSSYGIE